MFIHPISGALHDFTLRIHLKNKMQLIWVINTLKLAV